MRRVRLGTSARLALASLLAVLPLGLVWSRTSGYLTLPSYDPGTCTYADAGDLCYEPTSTPGSYVPGSVLHGYSTSARVLLVAAAVLLLVCAVRRRTAATLRLARAACVVLAAGAALALAGRASGSLVSLGIALALVVPLVWRPERRRRLLAPGTSSG
ncbi:MAG: hypothetical protein ACTHMS_02295 [Jatrophihabitans sp.]|uniref:hypothetical protein n=1 Tax=Jatrophihabitans sp. TaxID=1932789 RepID=UPI003F80854E